MDTRIRIRSGRSAILRGTLRSSSRRRLRFTRGRGPVIRCTSTVVVRRRRVVHLVHRLLTMTTTDTFRHMDMDMRRRRTRITTTTGAPPTALMVIAATVADTATTRRDHPTPTMEQDVRLMGSRRRLLSEVRESNSKAVRRRGVAVVRDSGVEMPVASARPSMPNPTTARCRKPRWKERSWRTIG